MAVTVGDRFGRLIVERLYTETVNGRWNKWAVCLCDCGSKKKVRYDQLGKSTNSCGCLLRESNSRRTKERNIRTAKHGGFCINNRWTYRSWESMISRCYNSNQDSYKDYGARGVTVCAFLREGPQYLVQLIGSRTKEKPSLDRFPISNGNYSCGECEECRLNGWQRNIRWATRKDQSNNRGSFNVYITAFGLTMTRGQWADLSGIDSERLRLRQKSGWSAEKMLTTPSKGKCYKPLMIEDIVSSV